MAVLKLADQVGAGREGSGGPRPPGRAGSGWESDGLIRGVPGRGGRLSAAARLRGRRLSAARGSARLAPGCRPEPCLSIRAVRELQLGSGKWRWAGGCERF